MIEDLGQVSRDVQVRSDVCIIGGGAAGITLANALAKSKLKVCLVEGGGLEFEEQSQDLFQAKEVGMPAGMYSGRLRQLGGSTNHWGGRCGRLDAIDFKERAWVPHSGWPIDGQVLAPYYDKALGICGFPATWPTDEATLAALPTGLPQFTSPWVKPYVWRYTPSRDEVGLRFGAVYRPQLQQSPSVRAFLHGNFIRFEMNPNGDAVAGAHFRAMNGSRLHVEAKTFILSAGGAENPRLLLIGDGQKPVGNATGMVGRYFTQHARCHAATLHLTEKAARLSEYFNYDVLKNLRRIDKSIPNTQVGLAITDKAMVDKGLLNASLAFDYVYPEHFAHKSDGGDGVTAQNILRSSSELLDNLGYELAAIDAKLHDRRRPATSVNLVIDVEQRPMPDNRLTLSNERDALGLPRSQVTWRISEQERATAGVLATAAASEFARMGWGRARMERWTHDADVPLETAMYTTFHFSGATRMASDPRAGVVDANCKVHGVGNLYVAGSSVFPTVGHVNPTFTIVALALRLADQISATSRHA